MVLPRIQLVKNLSGKKVLLRLDLNVPIKDGVVQDDFRLKKSLETIEFLRKEGARLIIVSHIASGVSHSLNAPLGYLAKFFPITFVVDFQSPEGRNAINKMQPGDVVLLENIRHYPGETENDPEFAKQLASIADIYVNDAFSVSHRRHASIVGLPKQLPSYAGLLFQKELKELETAFHPPHPFLFILGGAKFETKLPLIRKFLPIASFIFIGGALAHNFYRARGMEIGDSVVSQNIFDLADMINDPKIVLPMDVVVETASGVVVKTPDEVRAGEKIFDAGPFTLQKLKALIGVSKFVLWNGPLGDYERGFQTGTMELARVLSESGVKSMVGGGDTLAVVSSLQAESKFSFVSTGGGAMLEYLVQTSLPGIEALQNSAN